MAGEFWMDAELVDQDTLDEQGQSLPYVQVINGNRDLKDLGANNIKYRGGLFIKNELSGTEEFAEAQGWAPYTSPWADDDEPDGYAGTTLRCQVLCYRRAWTWDGGMMPWGMFDQAREQAAGERVKGRLQVQMLPADLAEPFVLTLGGMQGALFNRSKKGNSVLDMFKHCILGPANAITKKHGGSNKWAYRAFEVTLGMAVVDGKPMFIKVGKEPNTFQLTPLMLLQADGKTPLVEPLDRAGISEIYVGRERLAEANLLYDAAEEWRTAWDTVESIQATMSQQPQQKVDTSDFDGIDLDGDEDF